MIKKKNECLQVYISGWQTNNHNLRHTTQVWMKQTNASEFLFVFEYKKSQNSLHETTYTCPGSFPLKTISD